MQMGGEALAGQQQQQWGGGGGIGIGGGEKERGGAGAASNLHTHKQQNCPRTIRGHSFHLPPPPLLQKLVPAAAVHRDALKVAALEQLAENAGAARDLTDPQMQSQREPDGWDGWLPG
jgi:hypothetical protein